MKQKKKGKSDLINLDDYEIESEEHDKSFQMSIHATDGYFKSNI